MREPGAITFGDISLRKNCFDSSTITGFKTARRYLRKRPNLCTNRRKGTARQLLQNQNTTHERSIVSSTPTVSKLIGSQTVINKTSINDPKTHQKNLSSFVYNVTVGPVGNFFKYISTACYHALKPNKHWWIADDLVPQSKNIVTEYHTQHPSYNFMHTGLSKFPSEFTRIYPRHFILYNYFARQLTKAAQPLTGVPSQMEPTFRLYRPQYGMKQSTTETEHIRTFSYTEKFLKETRNSSEMYTAI